MSRIRLLPETVASQVAAGEVVERPASVIKELVENSIDAGARKIDVLIRRGGISLMRVVDDGSGMDRDDALLSLERHATSKIRSVSDLEAIGTLGFRGEALPSIASVSRFRLTTREPNAVAGTEIVVNGGKIDIVRDGGEAPGTQVEVRSLFYNVPARRKFLRAENTESRNIEHQLHLQAIGHPQIAFTFARDERAIFQLPPTSNLADRVRDLYGSDLLDQLLAVNEVDSSRVRTSGLIGRAGLSRQTRSQQLVFVNGRAIESPLITAAIREGYHTALMKGQYPVTFLFLEADQNFKPRTQQFQIIGVLNKLYVLMENADGLVLVDQHAAHERVLFEELRRRMEEEGVPSQKLLISQTFELAPRDADWIDQNMSILQKMGIGIESFGPNTFKVDSLPGFLSVTDGAQFMRKVIDDLKSASDRSSPLRLGEEMIAMTVCRHAVKANDPLRYLEVEKLIQDLLECDLPYCCPHGRPTMIQISNAELEKKFGRKV